MTTENGNKKSESSYLDDSLRVSLYHKQLMDDISNQQFNQKETLLNTIGKSEELLLSLGYSIPDIQSKQFSGSVVKKNAVSLVRSWDDILNEAKKSTPERVNFNDLLTQGEIDAVWQRHSLIGKELDWFATIDRYDFALSVATGIIAGVIDVLLVKVPVHKGFLGSPASEGGWLSNIIKEKSGSLFPKEKIQQLEKAYRVSYDPSNNSNLLEEVSGLGPRSHRYQSLGHDPFLGFIFGVRDILAGDFSAIGKDGSLVIQHVADPFLQGENLFVRIFEALKNHMGHLASDVSTASGLPAPLMPLLSFLQFGEIGNKKYTIGEVARQMYRSGYDFRHFIAGAIPVLLTEVIIRIGYFAKSISNGKTLSESIPSASSIKLRRQLLIAHSVATFINAGKVYLTSNPLSISWAQTLAFLRYVMPELAFLVIGKEAAMSRLVEEEIFKSYHAINNEISVSLSKQGQFCLEI